jgi:adenylate kinase family enzyme
MDKKLIIITGYVAAGKTTFSLQLSEKLNLPCFNKDLMKIELGKNIEINNREDSKRLSVTTFNIMMHILESFMKVEQPLIIESNFGYTNGEHIKQLLEKYNYQALTYLFMGDLKILHKRFVERDESPERDKINRINGLLDEYCVFESAIKPLGEFNIGNKIIKIDTTDFSKIKFDTYFEEAYNFIYKNKI